MTVDEDESQWWSQIFVCHYGQDLLTHQQGWRKLSEEEEHRGNPKSVVRDVVVVYGTLVTKQLSQVEKKYRRTVSHIGRLISLEMGSLN